MGRVFAELCKSTERNDVSARVDRDGSVVTFVTTGTGPFVCLPPRLRLLGLDLLYSPLPGEVKLYLFVLSPSHTWK